MRIYQEIDVDVLFDQVGVNFSTPVAKHALARFNTVSKQSPIIPAGNFSLRHGDDYYIAMDENSLVKINAHGIQVVPNAGQVYVKLNGDPWVYTPSNDNVAYLTRIVVSLFPESPVPQVATVIENGKEPILNLTKNQCPLFLVATLVALCMDANLPLTVVTGDPGAGKTTLLNCALKLLFGPSASVSRIPTKEQDLTTTLNKKRVVGLDNLEVVKEDILDLLCTVVTGGTITNRKLFTDKETVDLNIRNLVMVSAVDPSPLYRADVLDRMLGIHYERGISRKPESHFYAIVAKERDRFLSALVQVAQSVLAKPMSLTPKHRLVEWYHAAICCGLNDDDFINLRLRNESCSLERLPLLDAIKCFHVKGQNPNWPKTGLELHAQLNEFLVRSLNYTMLRQIPDSWRKMATIIRQNAAVFESECGLKLTYSGSNVALQWVPRSSP